MLLSWELQGIKTEAIKERVESEQDEGERLLMWKQLQSWLQRIIAREGSSSLITFMLQDHPQLMLKKKTVSPFLKRVLVDTTQQLQKYNMHFHDYSVNLFLTIDLVRVSGSLSLLLGTEWITNENLLCSTGNSTQCSVVTYMGRKFKKEWIYVHIIADSLCCLAETKQHCKATIL